MARATDAMQDAEEATEVDAEKAFHLPTAGLMETATIPVLLAAKQRPKDISTTPHL